MWVFLAGVVVGIGLAYVALVVWAACAMVAQVERIVVGE